MAQPCYRVSFHRWRGLSVLSWYVLSEMTPLTDTSLTFTVDEFSIVCVRELDFPQVTF